MKNQNYKNHRRFIILYHIATFGTILAVLIGSLINVIKSSGTSGLYSASLLFAISLILVSLFFFARIFALKAQDRAIRAEENFRHYLLTGKALPSGLHAKQSVGLRFASDDELKDLAEKASKENLSGEEIKKLIKNWRADYYRV